MQGTHFHSFLYEVLFLEFSSFWVNPDEGLRSGRKFGNLSNVSALEDDSGVLG
jgi:hypothetical protein